MEEAMLGDCTKNLVLLKDGDCGRCAGGAGIWLSGGGITCYDKEVS